MYPTGSDGTYTSYDLFLCNSLYGSFLLRDRDRHFLFNFFFCKMTILAVRWLRENAQLNVLQADCEFNAAKVHDFQYSAF